MTEQINPILSQAITLSPGFPVTVQAEAAHLLAIWLVKYSKHYKNRNLGEATGIARELLDLPPTRKQERAKRYGKALTR